MESKPKVPQTRTHLFSTEIDAPVEKVWSIVQDHDAYMKWTAPFMEGSYFEGSWAEGGRIHFLAPGGEGMCSDIAESRLHEIITIKHIGVVKDGVEDTTSDEVRSWAPAVETYRFVSIPGGTEFTVEQDLSPEHEQFMTTTWGKALAILKSLCEDT